MKGVTCTDTGKGPQKSRSSHEVNMKIFMVVSIAIGAIFLVVSLYAESPKDPKTLFEETCSECHSIEIPKEKRLSKADWQDIVNRMKSNGLTIKEEDERIIVEYLSRTYGVK